MAREGGPWWASSFQPEVVPRVLGCSPVLSAQDFMASPYLEQIHLPGLWMGAGYGVVWGANGTAPGLSLLPSVPSATPPPPPLPGLALPGSSTAYKEGA